MTKGETVFVKQVSYSRDEENLVLAFTLPVKCKLGPCRADKRNGWTIQPVDKIESNQLKYFNGNHSPDGMIKWLNEGFYVIWEKDIATPLDMIKAKRDKWKKAI